MAFAILPNRTHRLFRPQKHLLLSERILLGCASPSSTDFVSFFFDLLLRRGDESTTTMLVTHPVPSRPKRTARGTHSRGSLEPVHPGRRPYGRCFSPSVAGSCCGAVCSGHHHLWKHGWSARPAWVCLVCVAKGCARRRVNVGKKGGIVNRPELEFHWKREGGDFGRVIYREIGRVRCRVS